MSRLFKSAVKFDQTPCCDAYTGSFSFNGQFKAWAEVTRDSEVAQRRILGTGPDIVIPTRRAVNALGEVYIIGTRNQDTFRGRPIRAGYTASLVDGLASIQTLDEVCLSVAGTSAYGGRAWIKNDAFAQQDSKLNPQHQLFFSVSESIPDGSVVSLNGLMFLVRTSYDAPSGIQVVLADQLESPNLEVCTLETRVFDPITNTSASTTVGLTALRIRWQSLFFYDQAAAPTFAAGDIQVVVPKVSATPIAGSTFVLSDGRWTILSVVSYAQSWVCRVARAG